MAPHPLRREPVRRGARCRESDQRWRRRAEGPTRPSAATPTAGAAALARLGRRNDFKSSDDYVFCNRFGDHLDPSALRRRYKRAAAAAGLCPIKLHGRHHSAGSMLARAVPLVTVRDVLGHADLRTTNRYFHTKIDPAAVAAVNVAFGADGEGQTVPAEPPD